MVIGAIAARAQKGAPPTCKGVDDHATWAMHYNVDNQMQGRGRARYNNLQAWKVAP